ncbi:alpha/beta fold hydrolase [Streptomyces sp. NPDC048696]
MQWYPNAQLEVLPNTGHYAPEESAQAVAAAVEPYLGR